MNRPTKLRPSQGGRMWGPTPGLSPVLRKADCSRLDDEVFEGTCHLCGLEQPTLRLVGSELQCYVCRFPGRCCLCGKHLNHKALHDPGEIEWTVCRDCIGSVEDIHGRCGEVFGIVTDDEPDDPTSLWCLCLVMGGLATMQGIMDLLRGHGRSIAYPDGY